MNLNLVPMFVKSVLIICLNVLVVQQTHHVHNVNKVMLWLLIKNHV